MLTRRARNLPAQRPSLCANRSPHRINRNLFHPGKINDQSVRTSPSQVTVSARAHGKFQAIAPGKFHGTQCILLAHALHDDPRPPLRCCIPVKDPPRAFVRGICGENEVPFECSAQLVDRAATELIPIGYVQTPTPGNGADHRRDWDDSFDEVTSRVRTHFREISTTGLPSASSFGWMPRPGDFDAAMRPFTRLGAPSAVLTVT